jgi:hypothetical protein
MLISKLCKMTLLLGLLIILVGCVTTCPTKPMMPVKPILSPTSTDSGVLLTLEDVTALSEYIIELEDGY